jgi:hypothetical protein
MKWLLIIFSASIAVEGKIAIKFRFPFALAKSFLLKPSPVKVHRANSIELPRESFSSCTNFSSTHRRTSSFSFLRDEIHLSVNAFSSGTLHHYSKVISISRARQGEIEKGLTSLALGKVFYDRHEF